jgi:chromate transporter
MWDIFKTFFILGCVSFGGPAAHIGYFRQTFVDKLAWLSDRQYAEFVALSQFLPGPGSSQVGFAVGYHRLGLRGACCAFLGFTLPSIILMLLLVSSAGKLADSLIFQSVIQSLKLLAVVVVFDAVLMMYKNFCKESTHIALCLMSACIALIWPTLLGQMLVLTAAACVGVILLNIRNKELPKTKTHCLIKNIFTCVNYIPLILFLLLLFVLPLFSFLSPMMAVFNDFFNAGSLVFGGGHVVLPLLETMVGDQLSADSFLTGYAIAQAVPGPMFTFATYLGYVLLPSAPLMGALFATMGIFLPGFLLLLSCLKNWKRLSRMPYLAAAMNGVNAAVVGLLISALYQPVFTSAVFTGTDMAMVLVGIYLLKVKKMPVTWLVFLFAITGVGLSLI